MNARHLLLIPVIVAATACARKTDLVSAGSEHRALLTTELTIGSDGEDPDYLFSSIQDLLQVRDGSIWVIDGPAFRSRVIRRFSEDGGYLGQVGRAVMRDASRSSTFTVYHTDGSPDTTWTFGSPLSSSTPPPTSMQAAEGGTLWVQAVINAVQRFEGGMRRGAGISTLVRLRSNGSIADTVYFPQRPEMPIERVTVTRINPSGGRSSSGFRLPYQPHPAGPAGRAHERRGTPRFTGVPAGPGGRRGGHGVGTGPSDSGGEATIQGHPIRERRSHLGLGVRPF